MTHDEKRQAIRQKCVEANTDSFYEKGPGGIVPSNYLLRPVRLADVLLALSQIAGDVFVNTNGLVRLITEDGFSDSSWDLRQDSLDDQSPECIDFLFQLLNPLES